MYDDNTDNDKKTDTSEVAEAAAENNKTITIQVSSDTQTITDIIENLVGRGALKNGEKSIMTPLKANLHLDLDNSLITIVSKNHDGK